MATDPEPSCGSSSTDSGGRKKANGFVKLNFSVYVCKGGPARHMSGHLSYGGSVEVPPLFLFFFQISDLFSFLKLHSLRFAYSIVLNGTLKSRSQARDFAIKGSFG